VKRTEVEFDPLYPLPGGWKWCPLDELISEPKTNIVDGPFGSDLKASEYTDNGIPIARLQNIDRNEFVHKNIKFITTKKAKELERHTFGPGDILVTKLGDPLGKACLAPQSIEKGVIVADLVRVRISQDTIDRHYLTYALNSPFISRQLTKHTKGTTRPRVNLGMIRKLPIPVAPRLLQERIVAEIEKQFSRLDEAVANLKRVKANLKRYKAAVLKAAVEGRLVPIKERRMVKIREISRLVTKGSSPNWQGFKYTRDGIVFVRSQNVGWGKLDLADVAHLQSAFNDKERKSVLKSGDVLLNIVGASIGRAAIVTSEIDGGNVNQAVAVIRVDQGAMLPSFLMWHLLSPGTQTRIHADKVDVARANVSLRDIQEFSVLLPSLVEQKQIVAQVERHLSIIEELQGACDANYARASYLRNAFLSRSFNPLGVSQFNRIGGHREAY
jgi:type I restriction enzyme S subunit